LEYFILSTDELLRTFRGIIVRSSLASDNPDQTSFLRNVSVSLHSDTA